jgi:aspartyl-tRNA(Asn)/glutamyl-tRNA(Gln) amidotransferase subunit B
MTIIERDSGKWLSTIGLEVHAQVSSNAKLFSGAATQFGAEPNTQVSLVDAAMPGMLPVINEYCVKQAVKTGMAINAQINKFSVFDRKNYFYPDLPQGYQISQYQEPIVGKGSLKISLPDGTNKEIGITRIHLEQDAGKSLHEHSPHHSFIDLNRSGIALMEIVSEPEMTSSIEAGEYMKKLRIILRYLGTCDGDMEKGSLRCDANVSVRRVGEDKLGTRCEIKNLNSIKNIMAAIDYEVVRQIEIIEAGGKIDQETRLFDVNTGMTRTMRSKEDAHDYRYFPDPDLLPLKLSDELIEQVRAELPELPDQKIERYTSNMGLSSYDANVLSADKEVAEYFEKVAAKHEPKLAANWISAELFGRLNKNNLEINESKVTADKLIGLLDLISNDTISGKIAKQVFDIMFDTGEEAALIVEKHGLVQVTDTGAITKIIEEVIAANQDKVAEYKSGKDKLFGFFVGQVMKVSGGKANPEIVNNILKQELSK